VNTPMASTRQLVCVVEGQGDVDAVPLLCERIRVSLQAWGWRVAAQPVRQQRSRLVDHKVVSPLRPPNADGLARAVLLARQRGDAVLVVCDSDDDCPATWGPAARDLASHLVASEAVMVVREYETWLLHACSQEELKRHGIRDVEARRGAKELLRRVIGNYQPTTHQLGRTKTMDLDRVRARSDSFDKLVRALGALFGVPTPPRPLI
jgi:hypothetical protein